MPRKLFTVQGFKLRFLAKSNQEGVNIIKVFFKINRLHANKHFLFIHIKEKKSHLQKDYTVQLPKF